MATIQRRAYAEMFGPTTGDRVRLADGRFVMIYNHTTQGRTPLNLAVSRSHLQTVVDRLELGLDTSLGAQSDSLSGGQLQRVGLARALYEGPKVLVLDEATSALDAQSENEISNALEALRGQVTVVLIAHRLNTVQNADLVFLVDDGKIADAGSFAELMARNESVLKAVDLMRVES